MGKDEENSSVFQAKPSSLVSWGSAGGCTIEEREGQGGTKMKGLMSSVPEMVSYAPSHTATSPRWITRLKSEPRITLPLRHLLRPRENGSGLELLGVSTELHSFLAERWQAWKGW